MDEDTHNYFIVKKKHKNQHFSMFKRINLMANGQIWCSSKSLKFTGCEPDSGIKFLRIDVH